MDNQNDRTGGSATRRAASLYALLDDPQMRVRPRPRADGTPGGRASYSHSPAPVDLGLLEQLDACAAELREHTHAHPRDDAERPAAVPAARAELYDWAREHTAVDVQPELDAIAWRHAAELGLRVGDQRTIREQPCPTCGCWGLLWDDDTRRVGCINRRCVTTSGRPTTWTLPQLAVHAVRRRARRHTGT